MVFVGSGFQGAFFGAFHLDGKGDIEGTDKVAWVLNKDTPDVASPLLSSGRIYFHKGKSGQLSCVDAATGKVHYAARRISGLDTVYSSPIAAGGHIYLTGSSGTTVVIKVADELYIIASNEIGETVGATPAAVDNQLFLRGDKHLYCIENLDTASRGGEKQ
jgi:outer membrane protein assembly factor BamB